MQIKFTVFEFFIDINHKIVYILTTKKKVKEKLYAQKMELEKESSDPYLFCFWIFHTNLYDPRR
jgi:hypothetical protein